MNNLSLSLMSGVDIPIVECQLVLHQPTIKEIALLGEENFFIGAQCLNISKNMIQVQGEVDLNIINNFQIFMMVMNDKSAADKKQSVKDLLSVIFPKYQIILTPASIIFKEEGQEEMITVDESNFNYLQEIIKEVFCLKKDVMAQNGGYNPADAKAKEIAEKLMRGRARVAAQRGDDKSSMFSQYLSILTVGLNSMSLDDCLNLTMFQMLDLVERYSLYTNWDIDIRARLAGAKPDESPDN